MRGKLKLGVKCLTSARYFVFFNLQCNLACADSRSHVWRLPGRRAAGSGAGGAHYTQQSSVCVLCVLVVNSTGNLAPFPSIPGFPSSPPACLCVRVTRARGRQILTERMISLFLNNPPFSPLEIAFRSFSHLWLSCPSPTKQAAADRKLLIALIISFSQASWSLPCLCNDNDNYVGLWRRLSLVILWG